MDTTNDKCGEKRGSAQAPIEESKGGNAPTPPDKPLGME